MNRKYLLNALIFLTLYAAGYWLATSFYKDDPTAMNWSDREAYNRKFIADFRQKSSNTSQQQVIQQLGGPDITEGFAKGNDYYQLMYYRTQRTISDGITTKTECTALLFINSQLVATGPDAEQQFYQVIHRT